MATVIQGPGKTEIAWTIWRLGFTSDDLLVGDALAQARGTPFAPAQAESSKPLAAFDDRAIVGEREFGT